MTKPIILPLEKGARRNCRVTFATRTQNFVWEIGFSFDISGEYWDFQYNRLREDAPPDRIALQLFDTLIDKRIDKRQKWKLPEIRFATDPSLIEAARHEIPFEGDYSAYGIRVNDRPFVVVHPNNINLSDTGSGFTDLNLINPVNAYLHAMYVGARRFLEEQTIQTSQALLNALAENMPLRNNELNSNLEDLREQLQGVIEAVQNQSLDREVANRTANGLKSLLEKFSDAFATQLGKRVADGLVWLAGLLIYLAALL